ncbi:hypothetical protein PO909_001310 [Leuciscus waleckii]
MTVASGGTTSAGIAVGFYGNGETCDGVNRLTYSLRHANRTVSGIHRLVSESTSAQSQTVDKNLQLLKDQYAKHTDYLSIIQKLQAQRGELVYQMADIPFWNNLSISLEDLATQIELYDWYRWLGYLGLLLFDVLICLLVLFGLIRNSKGTLIGVCFLGVLALVISWGSLGLELTVSSGFSDFCAAPDMYITKVSEQYTLIKKALLNTAVPLQSDLIIHRRLDALSKSVGRDNCVGVSSTSLCLFCVSKPFLFGWPERDHTFWSSLIEVDSGYGPLKNGLPVTYSLERKHFHWLEHV